MRAQTFQNGMGLSARRRGWPAPPQSCGVRKSSSSRTKNRARPTPLTALPMPHDEEKGCADTCPPPCGRRVGNMFIVAESPRGTPLIVLGPCWIVGSCTFLLIAGVTTGVMVLQVQPQHSWLLWAVGGTLLFTTSAAFCMTCAGDPGLFEGRATGQPSDWVFSDQAGLYRPPGRNVKWCKEAGTLVEDLDHFCPWTGTVIASKNLCSFQFFLCSLLGLILYVCFVLVMQP